MRRSARACIPLILSAAAAVLTGCAAVRRPDAEVAKSVEAADRRRLAAIVLASADDELPMALPVAGRINAELEAVPTPAPATVSGDGAADRFFSPAPAEHQQSFTFSVDSDRFLAEDSDADAGTGGRRQDGSKRRPQLGLRLFRFTVLGRPLHLRCSLKNKHLMFGAKITL